MITHFIFVLSVISFFFTPLPLFAQTDLNGTHHKAVELAREGNSKKSILLFKKLLAENPDDQKLLSDYLLVLSWNEQCAEVIGLYEGDLKAPEDYVLNAVAKCYRNLKKFDQAILSYERALLKHPDHRETRVGLAYALSDAGRGKKALEELEQLIAADQSDLAPHIAKAYLYERQRRYFKALDVYEAILKKNPDYAEAWRLKIKGLSTLGAHQIALETALSQPGFNRKNPADSALETHLQLNLAARHLRWGKKIDSLTQEERFKKIDLAVEILDDVLKRDPQNVRAQRNRMLAFFDRLEIQKGILSYEQIKIAGNPLPDSIELAAAKAYRSLNRPEEAIAIYRNILKKRPHDFKTRLNLFHSTLSLNRFEEAEALLSQLQAEESSPTVKKQGVLETNWRKVELESAAIWMTAYQDQLENAETRFKTLLDQAPRNGSLHSGLAHITLWRGWPRKALGEFEQILHHDPRYVGVRIGYATTLMQLNRYEKAEIEITKLLKQASFDPHVRQIQKEWQIHNQNEFWIYSDYRREERGSRAWYTETSLTSRPYFSNFRITGDVIRQKSNADNDQFSYTRFMTGLSYEGGQGLSLRQKISFDLAASGDTGSITHIAYQIDDYWRLDVGYESFSLDVPLRASVAAITAKSFDIGLGYRRDERKEFHFATNQVRLSDGNLRNRYSLQGRYKLTPGATYTHFLQLNVSSARNSLADRLYFNPRNDLSYAVTTSHHWRHNDPRPGRGFRQTLSGTVGVYHQDGFSAGLTGELKYTHEWDFSVGESLAYHITYNRQIYDGRAEHSPAFNIRLIHHF